MNTTQALRQLCPSLFNSDDKPLSVDEKRAMLTYLMNTGMRPADEVRAQLARLGAVTVDEDGKAWVDITDEVMRRRGSRGVAGEHDEKTERAVAECEREMAINDQKRRLREGGYVNSPTTKETTVSKPDREIIEDIHRAHGGARRSPTAEVTASQRAMYAAFGMTVEQANALHAKHGYTPDGRPHPETRLSTDEVLEKRFAELTAVQRDQLARRRISTARGLGVVLQLSKAAKGHYAPERDPAIVAAAVAEFDANMTKGGR